MISQIFRLAYHLVISSFSVSIKTFTFVEHVNVLSKSALYS